MKMSNSYCSGLQKGQQNQLGRRVFELQLICSVHLHRQMNRTALVSGIYATTSLGMSFSSLWLEDDLSSSSHQRIRN